MTLPFLILGLYLGLLIVALTLSSWAGHNAPAPDEARRVTDAAERAGVGHLSPPTRLSAIGLFLLAVIFGTTAYFWKLPVIWFCLVPLLAPPLVGVALFYCSRKLLRTSGQLVGLSTLDQRVTLTSRAVVGAVLCTEAVVGLVLLGTYSLALMQMPAEKARFLVYVAGSSLGLCSVIFARAAAGAHFASTQHTRELLDEPHPGSLAMLVTLNFHAPLLRMLSLVVLAALGHCALLAFDQVASAEDVVWLYPHFLKLLGLLGLVFAGLVVRTSEDETGSEGWIRGGIVYLVLMVAGAWSLSSELPEGWSRTVPAGLSFLYIALGLSVWSSNDRDEEKDLSFFDHALLRAPSSLLFLALLAVLVLSTTLSPPEGMKSSPLPSSALVSLLLAGTLAAVPMGFVWLLARDLATSSQRTAALAYIGQHHREHNRTKPSVQLLLTLPLLAFVISVGALAEGFPMSEKMDGLKWTLFGLGASTAGMVLAALTGQLKRACSKAAGSIALLTEEHGARTHEAASLNFETAVLLCRDAMGRWDASWLFLCLVPATVALVARPLVPWPMFQSLSLGLGLGAALLGVGLELVLNADENPSQRSLAQLSFVACLAQALWLLAASSVPTGGSVAL